VWNAHDLTSVSFTRVNHFVDPADLDPLPAPNYRLPPFHDLRQARLRWNPLRIPLIQAILRGCTEIRVAVSGAQASALAANGIPALRVVHNGIDTARFERAGPEAIRALRDRLGLAERRVVLFAGRLRPDKGSVQLIQAMDVLTRHMDDAALLILADRGYKKHGRMREQFARVFERHVVESGWLAGDDLAAAYHLADAVAVPSIYLDPFPTVNLEAMAAGRPIVVTCFGGSPEAVLDGETGYVVNPFDTERFADRLKALLDDEALRRTMGQAGARRAREMFSLERYAGQMLDLYREAAG
jgi:glycosyltransferase involved in cell wall biosynthesis